MSLVHDALQKAEREKLRKTGAQPLPAPKPSQPIGPARPKPVEPSAAMPATNVRGVVPFPALPFDPIPKKQPSVLLPVLIGIVALVALVAIGFLISIATSALRDSTRTIQADHGPGAMPAQNGAGRQGQEPARAPTVARDSGAIPRPPPAVGSSDSGFKLTGIMKDPADGKPAAVVNGRVVYESSYVDGATVKSIQLDRVTLDLNGKEILLRLN